jgi:hypothetical protein
MSKGRLRAQLGLLVGLFAFSSAPLPVLAAESTSQPQTESILLSPTNKRYELVAGSTKSDSFKITNDGKSEYTFVVYARPYSVNNEDYTADFDSSFKNADAYKWVQFEQPSYQIKPGQTIDVAYTIRVPANATPGGHYGVLFAETQPQESTTEGTAILRKKRVGAILYATVKGDVTTSGSFVGPDVPLLQFSSPLTIAQRVKNSGNTEFEVSHSVVVSDVFGGVKYRTDKRQFVLPDTTRRLVNDWASPSWIGLYKVEQQADFLDTKKSSVNYVLIVPVWVYLMLGLLIGGRVLYAVARRKRSA